MPYIPYADPPYRRPPYSSPGFEDSPILDQISVCLAYALADITEANGFHQTLSVSRDSLDFTGEAEHRDLSAWCGMDMGSDACRIIGRTMDAAGPKTCYTQRFMVGIHILGSTPERAEETRIACVIADVFKRIGELRAEGRAAKGVYCNGLADRLEAMGWEIGVSPVWFCTVVMIPIEVDYWVLTEDPYQQ